MTGAGPIVGVVSRSTGESMRLYNGRGRYNEWLFVSTAATQQPGAPAGAGAPGLPGRGQGPAGRGRGDDPAGRGRGGRGRGEMPGLTPFDRPVPPGRGPGGFQPSPFGRPGGPGGASSPFAPGQRGRL
jgi:translation initiation factor IF-2